MESCNFHWSCCQWQNFLKILARIYAHYVVNAFFLSNIFCTFFYLRIINYYYIYFQALIYILMVSLNLCICIYPLDFHNPIHHDKIFLMLNALNWFYDDDYWNILYDRDDNDDNYYFIFEKLLNSLKIVIDIVFKARMIYSVALFT